MRQARQLSYAGAIEHHGDNEGSKKLYMTNSNGLSANVSNNNFGNTYHSVTYSFIIHQTTVYNHACPYVCVVMVVEIYCI